MNSENNTKILLGRTWQFNGDAWVEISENPPKTRQECFENILKILADPLEQEAIFRYFPFYATNN